MTAAYCRGCNVPCPAVATDELPGCPRPRLLPDVVAQVQAYLACSSQWRHAAMGGLTGLDYASCRAALEVLEPRASAARLRRLFMGVREVEQAILQVQSEARVAKATGEARDH